MNKDTVAMIAHDIQFYGRIMEEIKISLVLDSSRMFDLYHAAESVYVALMNLKKLYEVEVKKCYD
jgi:hypothetical protein